LLRRSSTSSGGFDPILLHAHNPGPFTGAGNNTYLVVGEAGAALIDAGTGDARHLGHLDRELAERNAALGDVLVTHAHSDHATGAAAVQRRHVSARFHKFPWESEDRKYEVDWLPVRDGDRFLDDASTLVALHTPGHSPDHLAFWHEASATVFSGDLAIAGGSVLIHTSGGGDLRQYLDSLNRVRRLRPRRLLPAHGPEITDPDAALRQALEHRLRREQQVLDALAQGCRTVESIAESIYHDLNPALVPAACENVRAHLLKLKQEGRALEEESSHTWTT
jgi:glyoxylase-like metal-dependent hydrolase (beta-lactamase superfamily II)